MKKNYYLLLSLFLVSLSFSCDTIENDNFTDPNAGFPWLGKKVLVEDFTGYKCTNCPAASAELYTIEELSINNAECKGCNNLSSCSAFSIFSVQLF